MMQKFNKIQLICKDWFDSKEMNSMLNSQSRCVCSLFAHQMQEKGIHLAVGRGLVVEFSKKIHGNEYYLSEGWHFLNIQTDVRGFLNIPSVLEKKKYFLSLILDAFERLDIFSDEKILTQEILEIFNDLKEIKYENVWPWNAGKKFSPSRRLFTQVKVAHEIDHFQIRFYVFSKNNELIYEDNVRIDSSQEPVITDALGQLKWLDESRVAIFSASQHGNEIVFSGW